MTNIVDVTNVSKNVLEALLDSNMGKKDIDLSHLSTEESYQLAKAMGWPMDARTRNWCNFGRKSNRGQSQDAFDCEAAILTRQEDNGNNV